MEDTLDKYSADEILDNVSESVLFLKGQSYDWTRKYATIHLSVAIKYLEHLKNRFENKPFTPSK